MFYYLQPNPLLTDTPGLKRQELPHSGKCLELKDLASDSSTVVYQDKLLLNFSGSLSPLV